MKSKTLSIANHPQHRKTINLALGRQHDAPLTDDDVRLVLQSPLGGVLKQVFNTAISLQILHEFYIAHPTNKIDPSLGKLLLAMLLGDSKSSRKASAGMPPAPRTEKTKVTTSKEGLSLQDRLEKLYGKASTLTDKMDGLYSQRANIEQQLQETITLQQQQWIDTIESKGGRLSPPQAAALQRFSKEQVERLDEAYTCLSPSSPKPTELTDPAAPEPTPVSHVDQVNFLGQFFGEAGSASGMLGLLKVVQRVEHTIATTLFKTQQNELNPFVTALRRVDERIEETAKVLHTTLKELDSQLSTNHTPLSSNFYASFSSNTRGEEKSDKNEPPTGPALNNN